MKLTITTLHQTSYKERAQITFETVPYLWPEVKAELEKVALEKKQARDLWRSSPLLEKVLLKQIAPIALALLEKKSLRLLADHLFASTFTSKSPMETFFGFQPIQLVVCIGEGLTFLHPNMPYPQREDHYFAVFGLERSRYVQKATDPEANLLKKMGYGFGDLLTNETHPLVFSK